MSSVVVLMVVSYFSHIDQEIVDYILDEKARQEYPLKNQIGCPIEPGSYWNLDCA